MELTESDNVQTNWQARGSRSDADFKGSATAQVLSCGIYQPDWLDEHTAECPKKIAHNMNDQCGARCRDLARVL